MQKTVEGIIAKATYNITDGDYVGEDGLYRCGKCHSKKQTFFTGLGDKRLVPCICDCEAAERQAEEDARKHRELVMRLRKKCFKNQKMTEWTFANDDGLTPKFITAMKNYVENFDKFKEEGKGILLFGSVGGGKTYLTACVANALINKGVPCVFKTFRDIENETNGLYPEEKTRYLDTLNSYALMILDDLGAERDTEFMQKDIVYAIINARYLANLPVLVTSNYTREELLNPKDLTQQRVFSRLFEMCTPVELTGKDRRKMALKDNIGEMKTILGLE